MKKILVLATALIAFFALSACDSSTTTGHHWRRSSGEQTVVVVNIKPGAEVLRPAIENSVQDWDRNPRIRVVIRDQCQDGQNCVPIRGERRNGGIATRGVTAEKHILTGTGTFIIFDNSSGQDLAQLQNGVCHELGHIFGLDHSSDGTQGPCQNGNPTQHDQDLVTENHNHVDNAGPPGV